MDPNGTNSGSANQTSLHIPTHSDSLAVIDPLCLTLAPNSPREESDQYRPAELGMTCKQTESGWCKIAYDCVFRNMSVPLCPDLTRTESKSMSATSSTATTASGTTTVTVTGTVGGLITASATPTSVPFAGQKSRSFGWALAIVVGLVIAISLDGQLLDILLM